MRQDFSEANRTSLDRLRQFIAGASDDDLSRPMSDGWTVAAYLAHVAFFDRRTARLIERWGQDGVGPSPMDVHVLNDAMKPLLLLLTPAAAASEAIAAAEEANAAVANLSDDLMDKVLAGQSVKLDRSEHRNHHLNEFEALG